MNRLNRPMGPGGLAALLGLAMLTGSVQAQEPIPLVFSVTSDDHPSEVRKRYREFHRIIEEQLNNRLSDQQVAVQLAIAPNYEVAIQQMVSGEAQFGRLTPVAYVIVQQQNPEVALLAAEVYRDEDGDDHSHGVLMVHNDSPVQSLTDLKGKSIAFVSPHATAGRYHAQELLQETAQLNAADFSKFDYLGRNDKVLEAVGNGEFDAGASTLQAFKDEVEHGLPVRLLTEYTVPYTPWVASTTLSPALRDALQAVLLEMDDPALLEAGGVDDFVAVEDTEYEVTRHAMEHGGQYDPQ